MNNPEQIGGKSWRRIPPLGMLAFAAFVVCALTGIMLVPAYLPGAAMDSLALLLLKNPAGVFARSLHYWSAQAFLVLTLAHLIDHLLRRSEATVSFGVWLRLCLTVPVTIGAMLSGFLLRGDAPAVQALQILRSLLGFLPLVGTTLSRLLTGSGSDLTVVYLQHACTATLIIWLVTIEHARRILPGAQAIFWTLPPVAALSLFLVPGLVSRGASIEKGPWYLVGLQELLHWLPWPQVAVWLALLGLLVLILLPVCSAQQRVWFRWIMAAATLAYVILTAVGIGLRGDGWRLQSPRTVWADQAHFISVRAYIPADTALLAKTVPMVSGQREGCLACHQGMTGFVAAHEPGTLGCAACHLGNPFTLNKTLAHAGMTLTPGNLSVVNRTCGASNCHGEVEIRVRGSLMNTMSGVVSVDKFVFGESPDLDAHFDVTALKHSPADTHLRGLCASCHLGQDKAQPGPIDESSRGGGCSACHLNYDSAAVAELQHRGGPTAPLHHPDISIQVHQQACFGCHSRSGRIATNYEGWHETQLDETAAKTRPGWPMQFRLLADGRVFEKHPADVHFEKGMTCIDCHVASEVMSDGIAHAHERNAVEISCVDCHASGATPAKEFAQLDSETQQITAMRKLNEPGRRFVVSQSSSVDYANVFLGNCGRPQVALIESAKVLQPKPAAAVCARSGSMHERLECGACHTAWAPQCVNCHTSFDPKTQGWDHLAGKFVVGAWQEEAGDYQSDAPPLGVSVSAGPNGKREERITTFVPGMILNLKLPSEQANSGSQFHRLFAPASPHTTAAQSRDCRSCHANPAALGYGRGQLKYEVKGGAGKWIFTPGYPRSPQDGLPMDAWIGFLQEQGANTTTRKNARPFSLKEQRNILLVGACLACHNEKDRRIAAVFADFKNYRAALSQQCRLPDWTDAVAQGREASQ
jgi:quinol-cytochrome oxidoreductase complex cytochrome b subunit